MKILKESITNVPDAKDTVAAIPFTLELAKEQSEKTEKEIEKAMEPNNEIVKDEPFTSGSDELKMKKPEAYKKMHLLESIFEDVNGGLDNQRLKELLSNAFDWASMVSDQSFEDMKNAIGITEDELLDLGFDSYEESLKEAKREDETEEDTVWNNVYNSLCTELDPIDRPEPFRKVGRGNRYDVIQTDYDGNIIVSGNTPEEFELAKRVADYYGLKSKMTDYSHRTWSKDPYKYTFTIYVSEEE